jgi:shikimate dehydrogenase
VLNRRCAVLGSPVRHSLSPVLHRAAYAELGLAWEYDAVEVTSADLPGFLAGLDGSWRGLSLTMPLKRTVLPLLDEVTERAAATGAANTVVLDGGRRTGHNTDVPGAAAAVRSRYDGPLRRAVILGGGATAASTLHALADLGCGEVVLVVRNPDRAAETIASAARHPAAPRVVVRRVGDGAVAADLLVSTIPASAQTPDVLALADPVAAVFEVVYDPWPTPLAAYASATGRVLVSGLDLLVAQAVLQVQLMTGSGDVPVAAMRAAGEAELARRPASPARPDPAG